MTKRKSKSTPTQYPELKVSLSEDGIVTAQFPRHYITSLKFWQDDFLRTIADRGLFGK